MRIFTLIWFGQLVSLIGSGLTQFALGVWVYQNTGSVTQFALIYLFTILPSILLSPLVGVLVDRWNRRNCMILSDVGAGVSTLAIALLLVIGKLEIWHIYLAVAISSIFNAFQWPAYAAATTMLVPKQHLGRASGMVQLAEATSRLLAPMLAGVLVVTIQIQGVILIDCVTFLVSLVTLLVVRFPEPKTTTDNEVKKSWRLQEFTYGWTYITARPGLLGLLIFFAVINFLTGVVSVLVTPLVLAFATANVLGTVLSIGGSGMLVGGLVMSVWGGPKNRILGVFGFSLSGALSIILAGLRPAVPVFFAAAFIYYFGVSMINGCDQAIWQRKVAPTVQGRVFAVRSMLAFASLPLAYLIAGPLVDGVFEPLLAPHGLLAGSVGKLIGVGRGYGIAFLFVVVGILNMIAIAFGYLYQPLRRLNQQLPDAIADIV
ncbi:MFS transporter [Nostoc sp. FACHB-87]|uniref:MFS transporter n=1 Tax=Nostocaceae TaxID=1162 RepID=UPI0016843EC2|nr:MULTISPECIES: MFS transporter [Nostocaceae]MBD2455146.1 MFS transporter [Nostoc sp. FACHB-87]MBD2477846.1 MFS transporter [Anabaena sp. FACHB-83]